MSNARLFRTVPTRALIALLSLQLALPLPLYAAQLVLATSPLATAGSVSIAPNVMFILDTSGSMAWDYTPDPIAYDNSDTSRPPMCYDAGDNTAVFNTGGTLGNIDEQRDYCQGGDPPYMSPDFNGSFYNPEVRYQAGVQSNGITIGNQALATARRDPYLNATTDNLEANYARRVWCTSQDDSASDAALCKENSGYFATLGTDYVFPDAGQVEGNLVGRRYGRSTGGTVKTRLGAPYYYRYLPNRYCTDSTLTLCTAATTATGAYTVPVPIRFCKEPAANPYSSPLTDCQATYNLATGYKVPEFLGWVRPASGAAHAAYGAIDIFSPVATGMAFSSVTIDGQSIISGSLTAANGDTPATIATNLAAAINSYTGGANEYRACVGTRTGDNTCSGAPSNRVTIFPQTAPGGSTALTGSAANGRVIAVTGGAVTAGTKATGSITISDGPVGPTRLTALTVGGTSVLSSAVDAPLGLDTVAKRDTFAATLATRITGGGYTATASGSTVTIRAPLADTAYNGNTIVPTWVPPHTATITINNSGSDSSVAISTITNGAGSPTTMTAAGSSTAATGTNDAGEADALANSVAGRITANGYSASANANVITVFAPIGVSLSSTPAVTQVPAVTGPTPGIANLALSRSSGATGSWRIDNIAVIPGGACTQSASNLISAATSSETNMGSLANSADANGVGADEYDVTSPGASIRITGTGSLVSGLLNGCTINVTVARTSGTGTITVGSRTSPNSAGPHTLVNVASFVGASDGLGAVTTRTAFTASANPTTSTSNLGGAVNATGPILASLSHLADGTNGATPVTRRDIGRFKRCDITSTADCDGLGAGVFPKGLGRSDCAAATTCTYAEEATNFANWYSYYRTRMQAMKTAAGLSFNSVADNYRVGFMTIWATSGNASTHYLKIDNFQTNKATWFTRLYNSTPANGTPLRSALSKAGRIFAGQNPLGFGTTDDPVQYSCQKNFAILTTDGYWNSDAASAIQKVDGTQMDNPDGVASVGRPFYDDAQPSTACGSTSGTARSCGTLADVAYYYNNTDLRTSAFGNCTGATVGASNLDVCPNNVKTSAIDAREYQHMTTFTLGLGVSGTLQYQEDYKTASSGDFAAVTAGSKSWPAAQDTHPTGVDDLWHAAVNGGGTYFSARSPASLVKNLTDALLSIQAETGAGAGAAASNLEPTATDNSVFQATYTTAQWSGNVAANRIDIVARTISSTPDWCIEDIVKSDGTLACTGSLKAKVAANSDTRNIYLRDGSISAAANKLRSFTFANLTAAEKALLAPTLLTQYTFLGVSAQANATTTSLIDYLRGQTQHEDQGGNPADMRVYRDRKATLGDIVGSQPTFVKAAPFSYTDLGYEAFKAATASRGATLYVGANDGMLHAFDTGNGGAERWAYIPGPMLGNLYRLADTSYANNHRYFVDAAPIAGDACLASCAGTPVWATILVGGYGGGGKGYYAIDITDPAAPKSLWEISSNDDADIGHSFGNPIITKRNDGKWVVLFTSGYNNVGSGRGYLFVVDAATGAILSKIDTGVGDSTTPSGLSKIEAFIDKAREENTTTHVYGGDLLGNLWRFTIDNGATGVVKIATLLDTSSVPQPITTKPILTNLNDANKTRYLAVATGKLLENSDLTTTQMQSVYAFVEKYDSDGTVGTCGGCADGARDQLNKTTLVRNVDAGGNDILDARGRPTRSTDGTVTAPSGTPIVQGCHFNLPEQGERVNINMNLVLGQLSIVSNVPKADACLGGGESWATIMNYRTCKVTQSYRIGNALTVGSSIIKIGSSYYTLNTSSGGDSEIGDEIPKGGLGTDFQGRRVGWRLLLD